MKGASSRNVGHEACSCGPVFGQPRPWVRRERGIALLVVMVAFVVLYLVVYQLHFSTSMEERIAQVRYGAVESALALHSASLYVLTLLVEDLKSSMSNAQQSTTQASAGVNQGTNQGTNQGAPSSKSATSRAGVQDQGSTVPLSLGGTGGTASKWYDSVHKTIFHYNQQQIGGVSVKILITDGERFLDLNRLFDYVRLPDEEITSGLEDMREEDVAALAGKDEKEAELTLRERLLKKKDTTKAATAQKSRSESSKETDGALAVGSGGSSGTSQGLGEIDQAMSEYEPDEEFFPPDDVRFQATRDMVERAVLMMFSVNENDYGYRYSVRYSASEIASDIVDYVLQRRSSLVQNRIYLVTELLNIPSITREVFYGPMPDIKEGEEIYVGQGFMLRRDEFGDVIPQYPEQLDDPYLQEQSTILENLKQQFGQFMDFPGMGRLKSNALTRGMTEPPVVMDEYGNESVLEVPTPIGLKDIFTTYSSGKINVNTASVPVLFGLLLSLDEADANEVALDIRDYRNRFQEEAEEEGVERVASGKETPDLGQPKRARKDTEASSTGGSGTSAAGSSSGYSYDPSSQEALGMSTYQDLETNYFTSLQQLELIDGTDESPQDRLRRDEGVERVDAETDTLFRRVIHDLEKVAVFGSTYFHAELKTKTKGGMMGEAGHLTVRRDPKTKRIEVMMWKNLQK